jgi:hypothetical protein
MGSVQYSKIRSLSINMLIFLRHIYRLNSTVKIPTHCFIGTYKIYLNFKTSNVQSNFERKQNVGGLVLLISRCNIKPLITKTIWHCFKGQIIHLYPWLNFNKHVKWKLLWMKLYFTKIFTSDMQTFPNFHFFK